MDLMTARAMDDRLLIRKWRFYATSLEVRIRLGRPTTDLARDLGYVEREMERRGIRHDDPRGDVLDSHGVWHES